MKKRALNPEKLSSIITSEVCDRNTYTFRNAYNIPRIQFRTTIYKFKCLHIYFENACVLINLIYYLTEK